MLLLNDEAELLACLLIDEAELLALLLKEDDVELLLEPQPAANTTSTAAPIAAALRERPNPIAPPTQHART